MEFIIKLDEENIRDYIKFIPKRKLVNMGFVIHESDIAVLFIWKKMCQRE